MNGVINCHLIGRFGNCMFQYAFARAYAEAHDCELRVTPWIGERIFQLPVNPIHDALPQRTEWNVGDGEVNVEFRTYAQTAKAMIYSRKQAKQWFQFKPNIQKLFDLVKVPECAAHRRVGDYFGYGYVVVSAASYERACEKFRLPKPEFVTEEKSAQIFGLRADFDFLPDFLRLVQAPILLRGNSSFSWWAATLGSGRVFAPVIDGLAGGREQECQFVEGNWPRLANLQHTQDLHLNEH